jgi:PAS domain S-box-containing protein
MKDLSLESLKNAAKLISKTDDPHEKFVTLSRAFELFSLEADRLEGAYNSLKEEFTAIHLELEAMNKKLIRKVAELDITTYYLESILGNISQGLLFIDLNGDVMTYNDTAEKILGKSRESVLFHNFWLNFSDNLFGFSMREALSTQTPPHTVFTTLKTKDGLHDIELEVNTTFVNEEGENGKGYYQEFAVKKLQGVIILIRDITDIRKLQLIANRNDRLKELGEMAAMVAHEIRNPLGGIKGFASLLRRDLKENPEQMQMASYIVEGTEILNRLVTNVLNYSRPLDVRKEAVDMIAILNELKHHFEADANTKDKVKIHLVHSMSKLMLRLDPQLIKNVFLNLIVNAQQAIEDKGTITITVEEASPYAAIKVADTGCGIPEQNIEQIFSPFFTTKVEGNGFGLAEVHKVIQEHEGIIEVESTVNVGTIFTIKLPLNQTGDK